MDKILVGLIAAILICSCDKPAELPLSAPLVVTQKIRAAGDDMDKTYPAEIKGRYESTLSFQTGGKVLTRNVNIGDCVRKGDTLMILDSRDIAESVNSSAAYLRQAEKQLELARSDFQRQKQLYDADVISTARYEQYVSRLEEAEAMHKQAEAQHVLHMNLLGYTKLKADSGGVITSVAAEAGQVVGAGQPVLSLVQMKELEAEAFIPENLIGATQAGQSVGVTIWALPGVHLQGVVREISPSADFVTRTFKVRITLLDVPDAVKLGMSASVKINMPLARAGAYAVPSSALYHTEGTSYLWTVDSSSHVHMRPVTVIRYKDDTADITGDLRGDEIIVISGVHKLAESQPVRVSLSGSGL